MNPPTVWRLGQADIVHLGLARAFWRRGLRFRTTQLDGRDREYEVIRLQDDEAYVTRSPDDYIADALETLALARIDPGVLRRVEAILRNDLTRQLREAAPPQPT